MAITEADKVKHLKWAWQNMKKRCNRPTKDAHRYIGRGIGYDPKWEAFEGFYKDLASRYKPGLSLDRIDNNKGYSADNCRWATAKEQSNNTGRNRIIELNGKTKTLAQWCDESEVKSSTIRQRYYVYGWSIEKALI